MEGRLLTDGRQGLMEMISQEHPADCTSASLCQSSLFRKIPSFWELGRLLLNNLCNDTAGKLPAHVCDCSRHTTREGPGQPMSRGRQWVSLLGTPAAPNPRATHKRCQSPGPHRRTCSPPRLPVWVDHNSFLPPAAFFALSHGTQVVIDLSFHRVTSYSSTSSAGENV